MKLHDFLNTSYTAYHATKNVCDMLTNSGFLPLNLGEKWDLTQGGKYFVTRNDSSVIAFVVGKNKVFNICESHTDSPSFKVKGNCVIPSCGVNRINTEKYGGGLLYSYLDRPLKIAGRLLVEGECGVQTQLVVSDYNVVIPSLCVHHNPTANDGLSLNAQVDTLPLLGDSDNDVYATLTSDVVLDADLYVVPATQAFVAGANNDYLCSARLDNLTSVYTSVQAIANCSAQNIAVVACLDNEEIGSGTRQGAPSFIQQVLDGVCFALGMDVSQKLYAYENGMALSVDNGHAVHPAHPEKSDPVLRVKMNGGVVVKHHTNYATDGLSSAILKKILLDNGIAFQDVYGNSNVRSGSTLGLVTARQLGIKVADIGLAQLAMHSACETCGNSDVETMQKCLTAFLSANVCGSDIK